MKIFTAAVEEKEFQFVCDWVNTRNGFKHVCTVLVNGNERLNCKVCYLNRTWESYEYQSVLHKAIEQISGKDSELKNTLIAKFDGRA